MGKGGRKGKKGVYIEEKTDITNRLIHQDGAIQSKKKKKEKKKMDIIQPVFSPPYPYNPCSPVLLVVLCPDKSQWQSHTNTH